MRHPPPQCALFCFTLGYRNLFPVACGLICLLVEHTSFLPALLPLLWVDFQRVPVFQEGSSNPLCSLLFLLCSSPSLFSSHSPPCQEDCPSSFLFISRSFPKVLRVTLGSLDCLTGWFMVSLKERAREGGEGKFMGK